MHRNDHAFVITPGSNTATSHLQANFGNFYSVLCQLPCHGGQHSVTICDAPSHTSWHCHAQRRFCPSVWQMQFQIFQIWAERGKIGKKNNIHSLFTLFSSNGFGKLLLTKDLLMTHTNIARKGQKRRWCGDTWRLVRVSHTQLTNSGFLCRDAINIFANFK